MPFGVIVLTVCLNVASNAKQDMQIAKRSMQKGNRCENTKNFTDARGLRPALYKGLHATAARLVQKMVAGADHGNRALGVKLAKMLYVPGVAHR